MSDIALSVENLNAETSSGKRLLHNVGFSLHQGQTLALLGESGSGKSLTAMSVLRLLPDTLRLRSGAVCFRGENLLALPEYAMQRVRGRDIAMIFQEPMTALNPVQTIGKQALEAVLLGKNLRGKQAKHCVLDLFEQVGLDDAERVFNAYQHELSGGMRQRVIIAMALSGEPALLIADEPTTALDVTTEAQVLRLIKTLQKRLGMTMLFISHDLAVVSNIADEMVVMRDGHVVDEGKTRGFFTGKRHAYSVSLRHAIPGQQTRARRLRRNGKYSSSVRDTRDTVTKNTDASDVLLDVAGLNVRYGKRGGWLRRGGNEMTAVSDMSFRLRRGHTLALVGESGSGKTSVAKAILGLEKPTGGCIRFDGVEVTAMKAQEMKQFRRQVQVVFQDPYMSLNPKRTIGETLAEGLREQKICDSEAQVQKHITGLLDDVGMPGDSVSRYPHEFSGGQRQRICIARALSVRPSLLICDEPTSALDVLVQAQILDLFKDLQAGHGLSYLFISHDLSVVAHMADEIAVMRHGRMTEFGDINIMREPKHEYTRELLAAVPKLRDE